MTYSDITATAALGISACSLSVSFWLAARDRASVRVRLELIQEMAENRYLLRMIAANWGRRRIRIVEYGGVTNWHGGFSSNEIEGNVMLEEHDTYQKDLYIEDVTNVRRVGAPTDYCRLFVVDSLGRRHYARRSFWMLRKLKRLSTKY